jgi:hypothetical protein
MPKQPAIDPSKLYLWRVTGSNLKPEGKSNRTIYILAATGKEASKKAKKYLNPRQYEDLEFSSNMAEQIEPGIFLQPEK